MEIDVTDKPKRAPSPAYDAALAIFNSFGGKLMCASDWAAAVADAVDAALTEARRSIAPERVGWQENGALKDRIADLEKRLGEALDVIACSKACREDAEKERDALRAEIADNKRIGDDCYRILDRALTDAGIPHIAVHFGTGLPEATLSSVRVRALAKQRDEAITERDRARAKLAEHERQATMTAPAQTVTLSLPTWMFTQQDVRDLLAKLNAAAAEDHA